MMTYDIVYVLPDGSTGAYAGSDKKAFLTEVNRCLELGYEFATHCTANKEDK